MFFRNCSCNWFCQSCGFLSHNEKHTPRVPRSNQLGVQIKDGLRYKSIGFRVQSWLEDLREHNPRIYRFIRQHQVEFDALMNEGKGDLVGDSNLTVEEMAAIFRLEEMGFERALVIRVFLAFNKNEQQAANYLLDHMHDDDDK